MRLAGGGAAPERVLAVDSPTGSSRQEHLSRERRSRLRQGYGAQAGGRRGGPVHGHPHTRLSMPGFEGHSARSATIGSTRVARRAGMKQAAVATSSKVPAVAVNVTGSVAVTP